MKELEVTVQLRNNRLKKRRKELNMTQKQMAAAINSHTAVYGALETLRESPRNKAGEWRPVALRLAAFHCVPVEELFPVAIESIEKTSISREVDVEMLALSVGDQQQHLALPSACVEEKELKTLLAKALQRLPPKEAEILRHLFGVDGVVEATSTAEIAAHLEVSCATAQYHIEKGLRNLRRSPYTKELVLFTDEEKIEWYTKYKEYC